MKLKPYPEYKDSGIEWLGEVPSHWGSERVSRLSRSGSRTFVDGDWIESPYITDQGVRLIQTGNIGTGFYKEQGFRYISEETFDELKCTEVMPGDILICRLGDPVARSCIAPDLGVKMITSVDVAILKIKASVEPRFVNYTFSSPDYLSWVGSLVRGSTRDRVSRSMLGAFAVPLPTFEEQSAIAEYLDRETAEIDAFIAEAERLIELLNERRTAAITQAVTKGLNPNAPMKDSGIEWLGQVPEHWEVRRLGGVAHIANGGTPPSGEQESWNGDIPFVTPPDLNGLDGKPIERWTRTITAHGMRHSGESRTGAVLLSTRAPVGHVGLVQMKSAFNQGCKALFPRETLRSVFLANFLVAARPILGSRATGTTFTELSSTELSSQLIPVPPLDEQDQIIESLENHRVSVKEAIATAREAIALARERRQALISAAVTGKIDVRSAL